MTKGVIYARVSSEEQVRTGYSISAQRKSVAKLFSKKKIQADKVFEEVHSAKDEGRPVFEQMVQFLVEHPEIRVVGVDKQDRLSRNLIDLGIIRDRLGCRVLSVKDPADDTPAGRFHQDINQAVANWYSNNLSQEVRKGMLEAFEAGRLMYKAPVGYKNIPRTRTRRASVVIDEKWASAIRSAFETHATGQTSLRTIAQELADQGLRTAAGRAYSPERVRRILSDPTYVGMVRMKGDVRQGQHPPIISRTIFNKVQQVILERHNHPGEKGKHLFLLRGLLYCTRCGRMMTAEHQARGSYYRCRSGSGTVQKCSAKYIRMAQLDDQVESILPSLSLRPECKEELVNALHSIADEHASTSSKERMRALSKLKTAESKLTRLTDGFARGAVPEPQYESLRDGYQAELHSLRAKLDHLDTDLEVDIAAAESILERSTGLSDFYAMAETLEARKELLQSTIKSIRIEDGTIKKIEYQEPFHLLLGDEPAAGSKRAVEVELLRYISGEGGRQSAKAL